MLNKTQCSQQALNWPMACQIWWQTVLCHCDSTLLIQ